MNTGERNIKGRIIYQGPRGGKYVLGASGSKMYKFTVAGGTPRIQNLRLNNRNINTGLRNMLTGTKIYINQESGKKYVIVDGRKTYTVRYNSGQKNINGTPILVKETMQKINRYIPRPSILQENIILNNFKNDQSINYIIRILKDSGFVYESIMIEKIQLAHSYYPKKHSLKNLSQYKNQITRSIAACHINTSGISKNQYLSSIYEQLKEASRIIRGKILFRKLSKQDFLDQFGQMVGGRPCIENLVQALTDIAIGESGWRGKNTSRLLQIYGNYMNRNSYNKLKNEILGPYIGEVYGKLSNAKKITFGKNDFWGAVKNKNVYAIKNGIISYYLLKNLNNAKYASNNAYNEYSEYLNRPNKYNVLVKAIKKRRAQIRR